MEIHFYFTCAARMHFFDTSSATHTLKKKKKDLIRKNSQHKTTIIIAKNFTKEILFFSLCFRSYDRGHCRNGKILPLLFDIVVVLLAEALCIFRFTIKKKLRESLSIPNWKIGRELYHVYGIWEKWNFASRFDSIRMHHVHKKKKKKI